jgi:hypothetical protein
VKSQKKARQGLGTAQSEKLKKKLFRALTCMVFLDQSFSTVLAEDV